MERSRNNNIYCSPLRYPGGKNCIFPFVSKLFYENALLGTSYAEPYAGGAGLALRLLLEGYVEKIFINDLDKSIYAFWTTIINYPEEFCKWVTEVDISMSNWAKYKDVQKNSGDVGVFELAKSTFFLNRTNVSGVLKGGVIGGQNQLGKYKIDARFNKKELISRILKIAEQKDKIIVSNLDGIAFIDNINRRKEDVFIYLDPPYFQKGADLYLNFYAEEDHKKLEKHVLKLKKKWMVSYDNHQFILNLYSGRQRIVYKLSQSTSNRVGDEIIIFSQELSFENSLKALKLPSLL